MKCTCTLDGGYKDVTDHPFTSSTNGSPDEHKVTTIGWSHLQHKSIVPTAVRVFFTHTHLCFANLPKYPNTKPRRNYFYYYVRRKISLQSIEEEIIASRKTTPATKKTRPKPYDKSSLGHSKLNLDCLRLTRQWTFQLIMCTRKSWREGQEIGCNIAIHGHALSSKINTKIWLSFSFWQKLNSLSLISY